MPPWSFLQLLGQEHATYSASTVAAASSMHGGSPSAAASPATQATSVSWISAGSTVAMGAPVLPPPPVWPSVLPPGLLLAPWPQPPQPDSPASGKSPVPALPTLLHSPLCPLTPPVHTPVSHPSAICLPHGASQPSSSAVGPGGSLGHSPAHTSFPSRHAHVPLPHGLHRPKMHPAGVCRLLCQQQHLHCQPGQPAPVPMSIWLPG